MHVYSGPAPTGEATNLGLAHALARRAEELSGYEAVHMYEPAGRFVVFSRREMRSPGFRDAADAAKKAGFTPLLRPTGGRAVAYTRKSLVIHHVRHAKDPREGHDSRFEHFGRQIAETLRELGVEAQLGAVPGEYCPGAHSVNARGETKLVGTAQRVLRHAWLFATLVITGDEECLAGVLSDVYRHLEEPFDPRSVGSVMNENPALTNEVLGGALLAGLASHPMPRSFGQDRDLLAEANKLAFDYGV